MLHFGFTSYARLYEVLSFLLRLLFNMKGKPLNGPSTQAKHFLLFMIVRLKICIGLLNPGKTVGKPRISQECLHIR